jgi:hypothetical protein
MVNGIRTSGTVDTKAAALVWEAELGLAPAEQIDATHNTRRDRFERYQ